MSSPSPRRDYYTRTGLDIPTRELLTFAMLMAMGGCEPQLRGHIQGNLKVGNDKATLLSVVTQLFPYVGPARPERHQLPQRGDPEPSQPGRPAPGRAALSTKKQIGSAEGKGGARRPALHGQCEPTADGSGHSGPVVDPGG